MSQLSTPGRLRVAVIGGGVAGLSAAYKLHESSPHIGVALYEASSRVGGILDSVSRNGFLIERSADSFITDPPHALDLCRRMGLADELIPTASRGRRALVLCGGRVVPVPDDFVIMAPRRLGPLIHSPVLSLMGKLRVLEEPLIPPRSDHMEDESVADFARRRFGREAYERLIQPLVGGIYTGDPERLSMAATMRRFWEAERACGSVLRALKSERALGPRANPERSSGARYDKFFSLRGGMSTLTDRLAAALPSGTVRLRHRVSSVHRDASGWQVRLDADSGPQSCIYDAVVAAVPAAVGAEVLPANVARRLGRIESAGAAVICLGYAREQVHHPLDAFGLVMPHVEGRSILAVSFLSTKFAGRGPGGSVLVRVFVGGALQPEKLDLPDAQLTELATRELEDLLGAEGPPQAVEIARWRGAMPQYHVGHLRLVDEIEGAVASHPGLAVAGNAFRGVGVAHCVQSGEEAARRVLEFLDCREPAT